MKLKSLIGAALVAGTLLSGTAMTSMVSASPEPSGWDDNNDQAVGSGSDTTYAFMPTGSMVPAAWPAIWLQSVMLQL